MKKSSNVRDKHHLRESIGVGGVGSTEVRIIESDLGVFGVAAKGLQDRLETGLLLPASVTGGDQGDDQPDAVYDGAFIGKPLVCRRFLLSLQQAHEVDASHGNLKIRIMARAGIGAGGAFPRKAPRITTVDQAIGVAGLSAATAGRGL
jgi:hypothetical protein